MERESTSIKGLIGNTTKRLSRQFEEKGVSLELNIPDGLPQVSVDTDRIGQVFINLIGNSLQYTPTGGSVLISGEEQNSQILIKISDTGIGLSADNISKIFTRFYRVDKSRSRAGGGSGIGLTIAKHLIESHGGEIGAASEGLGKGSIFWVLLQTK